ncbi:hypothetical protein CA830_11930 [Burkholderia multivorans]|nr:hypothetical protein CA830_11930 [Burkholderia multivorans]OXH92821.1 hypothetical protein CA831_01115 [Burkholderia multivorans]
MGRALGAAPDESETSGCLVHHQDANGVPFGESGSRVMPGRSIAGRTRFDGERARPVGEAGRPPRA